LSKEYEELTAKAEQHIASLEAVAWLRVGTAICGQAAGAADLLQIIPFLAEKRNLPFALSEVGCIGLCYAEPILDVQTPDGNRILYKNVDAAIAEKILDALVKGKIYKDNILGAITCTDKGVTLLKNTPMMKQQTRVALRNAGHIDPIDIFQYIANGGFKGLSKALNTMSGSEVIEEVTKSGLRGRGGAAFPTATKWSFLARSDKKTKYILCNCEEGDPGAFNDKGILESDPFTLIEGMIIAGYATGSSNGVIFIRHGHAGPIERTEKALEACYKHGILGTNILGTAFSYDIEVSLTGESYVAGEETALMEAVEGKRAMPRFRPPFPAQAGLWQQPSNINNVKTLAYVPEIVAKGGDWFAGIGTEKSKGTAIICLSGDIARPGMIEVPFGLTIRDVIEKIGGGARNSKSIKLLQTGGPLGGVLSGDQLDIVLDFDAMATAGAILGSGGIIVADEDTCSVHLTRNLIAFCQYESCGKCFPCRLGMSHLLEVIERITLLNGLESDKSLMERIGTSMQAGSLCGHGQLGFNPVSSALKYFKAEFDQHLEEHVCQTNQCLGPFIGPEKTRRWAHHTGSSPTAEVSDRFSSSQIQKQWISVIK